jgi:UDP-GlcNAc:undecaprenyl-phosphate GlcNAc-1-phosphate transferase
MMGAALGFLPYNRNPATIFMGDAGSMLLGLNAAIMLLLFAKSSVTFRWTLGSLMIFGLPLADMLLTLARRWRNQRPLMQGDRSHFYDQLVDRGWPIKRVVRVSYALAAFFAIMGCVPIVLRLRYIVPLYILVFAAVVGLVVKFKMVRVEPQQCAEPRSEACIQSEPRP